MFVQRSELYSIVYLVLVFFCFKPLHCYSENDAETDLTHITVDTWEKDNIVSNSPDYPVVSSNDTVPDLTDYHYPITRFTKLSETRHDKGFGSLDYYKNFQWHVTKVTGEQDLQLSKTNKKLEVLDLALVMDCTGSMGSWIEHSKNTLNNVIDHIRNRASSPEKELVIRVAFVGFRDFEDENDIFSVHDFTTDIQTIKNFITIQHASGGGDLPEDVAGAMHQVLQLSWYPGSTRLVSIIADAPTHGNRYHSDHGDVYPTGSPAGLVLEEMVKKFIDSRLDLTLYKLTDDTEKMYNIMKAEDNGNDWVHFVDMRQELKANRIQGYDDSSPYIASSYGTKSAAAAAYSYSIRSPYSTKTPDKPLEPKVVPKTRRKKHNKIAKPSKLRNFIRYLLGYT